MKLHNSSLDERPGPESRSVEVGRSGQGPPECPSLGNFGDIVETRRVKPSNELIGAPRDWWSKGHAVMERAFWLACKRGDWSQVAVRINYMAGLSRE
jgi:hypothetical protein